jgi:hypothetical protein
MPFFRVEVKLGTEGFLKTLVTTYEATQCHNAEHYNLNIIYFITEYYLLYITPCSVLKANQHFGGTFRLHLQGQKISSACHLLLCWFLASVVLRP